MNTPFEAVVGGIVVLPSFILIVMESDELGFPVSAPLCSLGGERFCFLRAPWCFCGKVDTMAYMSSADPGARLFIERVVTDDDGKPERVYMAAAWVERIRIIPDLSHLMVVAASPAYG